MLFFSHLCHSRYTKKETQWVAVKAILQSIQCVGISLIELFHKIKKGGHKGRGDDNNNNENNDINNNDDIDIKNDDDIKNDNDIDNDKSIDNVDNANNNENNDPVSKM